MTQFQWAETQDWFCLYGGFLAIGRRLLLSLMGLNRVWAFTDNPDFKGLKPFIDRLELKPHDFVDQLGQLLQSDAISSIRGFVSLSEAILELIEAHLPKLDTFSEREALRQVRHRTTHSV